MYVIQDYKRLKSDENSKLSLGWNLNREISKINYKIHTDAIKEYLLKDLTNEQLSYKYASEADMLNVALFNKRAKQWREENPELKARIEEIKTRVASSTSDYDKKQFQERLGKLTNGVAT